MQSNVQTNQETQAVVSTVGHMMALAAQIEAKRQELEAVTRRANQLREELNALEANTR